MEIKVKNRDYSIDLLKFFAAILVVNSHMDIMYGEYSMLATGGAIGDALFFFCSGYTLFWGRDLDFFNWYKRRINRIYPTIFALAVLRVILIDSDANIVDVLIQGGGWFVSCIMIYYIILWFVRRFFINHLIWPFAIDFIVIIIWYLTLGIDDNSGSNSMYGACYFKWCHYFTYMLLGAVLGHHKKQMQIEVNYSFMWSVVGLLISVILFYVLCWFKNKSGIYDILQMTSIIPLMGICWFLYRLCNTSIAQKVYNQKVVHPIICLIGGLCLEMYLVQPALFTDKMNKIFPLNLIIVFVAIVIAAYLLRCLARIWKQTFSDGEYDWREIVSLK